MKTQIDNLINGFKNVIRDENHPKYATAKKNAYGDQLHRHSSTTGKNSWYSSELTPDEFAVICSGNTVEWPAEMKFKSFDITIRNDCTVTVTRYGKKSEGATWKSREWHEIDEAFVTIKE